MHRCAFVPIEHDILVEILFSVMVASVHDICKIAILHNFTINCANISYRPDFGNQHVFKSKTTTESHVFGFMGI